MALDKLSSISVIGTRQYFSSHKRLDVYFVHPDKIDAYAYIRNIAETTGLKLDDLERLLVLKPASGRGSKEQTGSAMVIKPGLLSSDFLINTDNAAWTTDDDFNASEKGQLKNGDILVLSAAHATGYIGKNTSIFLTSDDTKAICIGELIRLRSDNKKINPYYLLAYLNNQKVRLFFQYSVRGQTVHLYPNDIRKIPVILPPRKIQDSIGNKLKRSIEAKLEARKKKKDIDEIFAKYLPVHFETSNDISFCYHKRIVLTEKRLDPRCHDVKIIKPLNFFFRKVKYPLKDLSTLLDRPIFYPSQFKRVSNPRENLYPMLSVGNISSSRLVEEGISYFNLPDKEKDRYMLKEGWIITARSGSITSVAIVDAKFNGYCASEHLLRIPAKKDYFPYYVYSFLTTIWGRLQIQRYIYGAVVPEISSRFLSKIKIPDLPIEVKQKIDRGQKQRFDLEEISLELRKQAMFELEKLLSTDGGA
ncbi:MAG: restriction endonuclease subunit S [Candidatus Helarchaeota archaeon]|nr:restriction endonuclease subunit S [Candidatus Helarchaeota archaeon]